MKHVGLALFLIGAWIGLSVGALAQTPVAPAAGNGTSGNPYQITVLGNLVWLHDQTAANKTAGKYYKLMNDINASTTANWNDSGTSTSVLEGFNPIGSESNQFLGAFDGAGHKITGLIINRPSEDYIGLFGHLGLSGGVRNLGLVGGTVTGRVYVGGLVGDSEEKVTIAACYATIAVTGNYYAGGLVGHSSFGWIKGCYATGAVRGDYYLGGLLGGSFGSVMISGCYATGAVMGNGAHGNYIGGLVGNIGDYAEISECYATGAVTGNFDVGGLVGCNWKSGISRCYATGAVTGSGSDNVYIGGLVGYIEDGGVSECYATGAMKGINAVGGLVGYDKNGMVSDSYWDKETSGQSSSGGGTGKTMAEMKQRATFASWDFGIWGIEDSYPYLRFTVAPISGDGLKTNPYQITKLDHLAWLRGQAVAGATDGKYYQLMNNIDASGTANWLYGFKPIGDDDSPPWSFNGLFDGAGHTITGLVINRPSEDYIGLFAQLGSGGEVRNLGLIGGTVTGGSYYVGALVGYSEGMVSACYATGPVTGTNDEVGGLVGENEGGTISQSYANGAITGYCAVGGLVGRNYEGTISQCYATGTVTGSDGLGGLVGDSYESTILECCATGAVTGRSSVGGLMGDNDGSITKCYATGKVAGNDYVGGLVGSSSGAISKCSATGKVTGSVWYVGGLMGCNYEGTISQCYATGAVTSLYYVGGLVGFNYDTITDCYATGAVTGSNGYPGGLVGCNYTKGTISQCYATGAVTPAGSSYVGGGLVRSNYGTVSNSYWDTETSGQSLSAGGTGKTTAQMKRQATYVGWDFTNIWAISAAINNGYPYLRALGGGGGSAPTVLYFSINSGAASTTNRTVTLNNTCTNAPTQYMASASSSFTGASWQTYSSAPNFTLSSGNGTKTVYFKAKNAKGQSGVNSDTITLNQPTAAGPAWILYE